MLLETGPEKDCALCPRLTAFRRENIAAYPDWYNGAVPPFGDHDGALLIVGLAPGLRGANRTGRPFTGDYAGDLLYPTLIKFGLAKGSYKASPSDGLQLNNCMITNAVRCVPPQNKPTGQEIKNCQPFLSDELTKLPNLKLVISLGRIAHESIVRAVNGKQKEYKFAHGAIHELPSRQKMINSYHCSRYNTNTGRLTQQMFEDVFASAVDYL